MIGSLLFVLAQIVAPPADDVHVHFRVWTEAAFSANAPNVITPGGEVEVHGPLFLGDTFRLQGLAALAITQAAGASSFDFTQPESWGTYASAKFSLWEEIGGYHAVSDGVVSISAEGRYRFFTSLSKQSFPERRYLREWGVGGRAVLSDPKGDEKASLSALWGKDERCGEFGSGQVTFDAVVPIHSWDIGSGTTKPLSVSFGAESCLSVGKSQNVVQRDALEAKVIVEWTKK